jgi:hypothetical protein
LVDLVVDPNLSAQEQRRLVRKLNSAQRANGSSSGGEAENSLSWRAAFNLRPKKVDTSDLRRCVFPSDLDALSYELLGRAQNVIRVISEYVVHSRYLSDLPTGERALRGHEWEIAVALKHISELTRENKRLIDGSPGPMTAAVLDSQRQALKLAEGAIASRITALERYASELRMADAAEGDWQAALKASSRNDQYLDLIARTAADELAISQIQGLTEQVVAARDVFREHLHQAALAAEALVLPVAPQN